MKKIKFLSASFAVLCVMAGSSYGGGNRSADVQITIDKEKKVSVLSQGIGASIHAIEDSITVTTKKSFGGSAWGANPCLNDSASWEKVFWHAQWLGLDWIRLEIEQRMYNPEQDKYTWDSYEMQLTYRYLDWCEANHVDVLLQQMWSNTAWMAYPSHRNSSLGILRSAPYDKELFAHSFATLLDYLVHTKGYTCIKWLNFINEPNEDWGWWQTPENLNKKEDLAPTFPIVRNALDAKNIDIPILGPTYSIKENPANFPFNAQLGGYDVHSYHAKFDWYDLDNNKGGFYPLKTTLGDFTCYVCYAKSENKPFFISEYGTVVYGLGDIASSREAVLKDAEMLIRSINIGVNGFSKWSFINRGDLDGQWQLIDTWDVAGRKLLPADAIAPHENSYNAFALLSRFVPRNSDVLATTVTGGNDGTYDRVFATTLLTPSGNYSILIINDSDKPYTVSVDLVQSLDRDFYSYRLDNLSPKKVKPGKAITLNPKELVTLSTYNLGADDLGKISE